MTAPFEWNPSRLSAQWFWKTSTSTPSDAATESRFNAIAFSGTTSERKVTSRGQNGCPLSAWDRRDDERGSARVRLAGARELGGHLRRGGRAAGGERVRARLRDVQAERRRRERDQERDGEQECDERPAEHAVD